MFEARDIDQAGAAIRLAEWLGGEPMHVDISANGLFATYEIPGRVLEFHPELAMSLSAQYHCVVAVLMNRQGLMLPVPQGEATS